MPINKREFWTQKKPEQEWQTIKFSHPDFGAIRIVHGFSAQTFNGESYIPVSMQRQDPDQGSDPVAEASVTFARAQVGDAIKEALKLITPGGWLTPITTELATWFDTERTTPSRYWLLYVSEGGISFSQDAVTVRFSDENPMVRSVAMLYDPSVFTGLELA